MSYVTTKDGVEIFYKDWGPKDAQPIYFHHGWPLSSDIHLTTALILVADLAGSRHDLRRAPLPDFNGDSNRQPASRA